MHVLTLTATPIPRTLQLALTGVRDLSLLATPPVDRLAIRTFISPFDPLSVREALLREKYRGGQSFYVVPRIKDQPEIAEFLKRAGARGQSFIVANGQMPPGELDDIMNAFYDGKFDVLVATTIVESGLDIPNANTLIVHRADHFGLAQLYQIRGRIGRAKARAYALFTVPPDRKLTDTAERRLGVLQSLETLGAGFQLASHDLDIRGAGNLLGDEQSGHIREVGYELYQSMLEEAVANLKNGDEDYEDKNEWSPQISLGMPVMIPEHYVPDLQLRMQLYRRLGDLNDIREIDAAGAELIDRFGPLPEEVEALLKVILVKALCRAGQCRKGRCRSQGRRHHACATTSSPIRPGWCGWCPIRPARCASSPIRNLCSPAIGRPRMPASRGPRRSCRGWPNWRKMRRHEAKSARFRPVIKVYGRSMPDIGCHNPLARPVGHVIARIQHLKGCSIRGGDSVHRDCQRSQGNSMNFRKPLVAGFAVAALMLSSLSAYAQDAAAPAAETPAPAAPAERAPAPADAAAACGRGCGRRAPAELAQGLRSAARWPAGLHHAPGRPGQWPVPRLVPAA